MLKKCRKPKPATLDDILRALHEIKELLMVTQSDILASLATLNSGIDTLIANSQAADLQPIADALAPIQAKVTSATTPATPPA